MAQQLKLFLVLLGCTPPNRHVEQHDIFLGVATTLEELFPEFKAFWPEGRVHVDAWREISKVENYRIVAKTKDLEKSTDNADGKLFLMNLGGYLEGKFEEQHYIVLTVKPNKGAATREAKETFFYQHNHFGTATSHIDDRYGIDVDDIYEIEELLSPTQKERYRIEIIPAENLPEDELHLGYVKLPEGV
jgi:hypothetical protein